MQEDLRAIWQRHFVASSGNSWDVRTEEGSPCSHALSSALQTCAAAAVMPVVLLDAARGLQTRLLVALRCSFLVPDSFDFSLYSLGESKVPKVQ